MGTQKPTTRTKIQGKVQVANPKTMRQDATVSRRASVESGVNAPHTTKSRRTSRQAEQRAEATVVPKAAANRGIAKAGLNRVKVTDVRLPKAGASRQQRRGVAQRSRKAS